MGNEAVRELLEAVAIYTSATGLAEQGATEQQRATEDAAVEKATKALESLGLPANSA